MQNKEYQCSYIRGLKRNVGNNIVAGILIAGVICAIQMVGSCEQPEIIHQPETHTDSLRINTDEQINEWDTTDTTVYQTEAKPKIKSTHKPK